MLSLIKADLLRILKDKMFLILCIIGAAVALVMVLIQYGLFSLMAGNSDSGFVIREAAAASELAISGFAPFSDFGLILAIFMIILLHKDFSNGTIRNKIIVGKSRREIHAASMIVVTIITVGIMLCYVLLSFIFSCIFLQPFKNSEDVGIFFAKVGLSILGWIMLSLAIGFFSFVMKNQALAIITYVIVGLVLTFAGSILTTVLNLDAEFAAQGAGFLSEGAKKAIEIFSNINVVSRMGSMSSTYEMLGMGSSKISGLMLGCYIPTAVCMSILFYGLGYVIFARKDLK